MGTPEEITDIRQREHDVMMLAFEFFLSGIALLPEFGMHEGPFSYGYEACLEEIQARLRCDEGEMYVADLFETYKEDIERRAKEKNDGQDG